MWLLLACQGPPVVERSSSVEPLEGALEIEAFAWQGDGLAVILQMQGPVSGVVPVEVVWTTGDVVSVEAAFYGGMSSEVALQLPSPCDTLRLDALFAVVRAVDGSWSTVAELAIEGEVVDGTTDVAVGGGHPRVAICGSAELVTLEVEHEGGYLFERLWGPGFLLRAGAATANMASAMALPQGVVTLEAVEPVTTPYALVVGAL